jgi:hypothetical protein
VAVNYCNNYENYGYLVYGTRGKENFLLYSLGIPTAVFLNVTPSGFINYS